MIERASIRLLQRSASAAISSWFDNLSCRSDFGLGLFESGRSFVEIDDQTGHAQLSLPSAAMISEDGSPMFTVASAVHDGSVIRSVVAQVSKSCVQSDLGVNASSNSILEVGRVQKRLT
jgi:fermentation-respiration switch protein FrsA (DUF1100 family)